MTREQERILVVDDQKAIRRLLHEKLFFYKMTRDLQRRLPLSTRYNRLLTMKQWEKQNEYTHIGD